MIPLFLILMQIWAGAYKVEQPTVAIRPSPFVFEVLSLPSSHLKQSEGYHAYMDRMTKEQQEAINELTAKLDELAVFWHDFYVTDKNTGVQGRKFTGHMWRGLMIFGRSS